MSNGWEGIDEDREKARVLLGRLPASAAQAAHDEDLDIPWLFALPEGERDAALTAFRALMTAVSKMSSDEDVLELIRITRQTWKPWALTAHQWSANPMVDRLTGTLAADGPLLYPRSDSRPDEHGESATGVVRAVDAYAARRWHEVAPTLPNSFCDRLATGGVGGWELQGKLGRVEIGNKTLAHHEARRLGAFRLPQTTGDRSRGAVRNTQLRERVGVLFAVDDANDIVWVTDAHFIDSTTPAP